MAIGYFRASGKIAPVLTIPGPGFAYSLPGLAEAFHDSAALLHVVVRPVTRSDRKYQFQVLDQETMARPVTKGVISENSVDGLSQTITGAYQLALTGEPGPVLLQLSKGVLGAHPAHGFDPKEVRVALPADPDPEVLEETVAFLMAAKRPFLIVGQGTLGVAEMLRELVELLSCPVLTTASGRGALPEDHALALGFDLNRGDVSALNEMIDTSDCVLAIGCKFSDVGAAHFQLKLPVDRLVHVDASSEVIGANYPSRLAVNGSAETILPRLVAAAKRRSELPSLGWTAAEIEDWKRRLCHVKGVAIAEPTVRGLKPATPGALLTRLRHALPRESIVVTGSGLHQDLVRRHFDVFAPRGLIVPTDLQSMGFGLPAAIGAKLAAPDRPVVAVLGDGGFAMSGMELLTAVRERIPLTVIVFNDRRLNLVRLQQFAAFGGSEGVDILNPDFKAFATAVGAQYALIDDNADEVIEDAIASDQVTLMEVRLGDSAAFQKIRARGLVRETVQRTLGPRAMHKLRNRVKRD